MAATCEKRRRRPQRPWLSYGSVAAYAIVLAPFAAAQQPIGRTTASEVKVSGAVDISHGQTLLGNGSAITAGDQTVGISLERGGALRLCSTSTVHLSKDRSVTDPANSALMMALDRGAIEANYTVGKYSDVLMTPDLRILISGPGHADLRIRVNTRGDTCVDNHGVDAPYVTVTSQLEGGAYRVLPDQRVSFQNGGLHEVVDHEPEPCGCPPLAPPSVATVAPGKAVGGPSSTPADTAFPIAQSEGLAATPKPTAPVVPEGQVHAQVTVPLTYNGETSAAQPPAPASAPPPPPAPAPAVEVKQPPAAPPQPAPRVTPSSEPSSLPAAPPQPQTQQAHGFFHQVGHFFSKIFGR